MDPLRPEMRAADLAKRLEAERGRAPFVEHLDSARHLMILSLGDRARVTIGRDEESDLALGWDPEVSRMHAVLERLGSTWTITDDGLSKNGSFVNGDRVDGRQRLVEGDRIGIGQTLIVFRDPHGAGNETAPATGRGVSGVIELTPAQRRVLESLCRPFADPGVATPATNREIAEDLVLSVEGVRSHMRALFVRLEVDAFPPNKKRAELVRRAFALGLVSRRDLAR